LKLIEPGELAILKLVFERSAEGTYEISQVLPVRLRPINGDPDDLFRLRDDLILEQPAYLSTIVSTLCQSIVPVVAIVKGEGAMRSLGTGFFVTATGLLITAAHVLTDPIERNYGGVHRVGQEDWSMGETQLGVMMSVGRDAWIFQRIEWAEFLSQRTEQALPIKGHSLKLASDIAICKVETMPDAIYQPLTLIQAGVRGTGLAVGKKATAIGYGGMQDTTLEMEQPGVVAGDFGFNLFVSTGTILEHLPDNSVNRQALTPGPCFRASLKLPGGMSGSPIFDDEGIYVHGVVSSGMNESDGLANHGYGSMLAPSMQLPISRLEGKSLLDLLNSKSDGMPTLRMAGG
jgi:hypothetical protein